MNGTGNGTVSVNDTRVNDTSGIPRIATMTGTASHCVINVNISAPSLINTEKQKEELQYEDKLPDWHTCISIFHRQCHLHVVMSMVICMFYIP